MFFGPKAQPQPQPAAAAPAGAVIFDVGGADFEERVLKASLEKPVIVDFWAPWCRPCKQLMPILEKAVNAAGGEVLLAKVNIDEHPELAQAMRVQSVPTVYALFGGRPVDAFAGAQPESATKVFVDKLVKIARGAKPDAVVIPDALKAAAQALAAGDLGTAQSLYAQILQQDEKNVEAYVGIVRVFIAASQLEQAQALIENAPPEIAKNSNFAAAKTALALAQKAPKGGFDDLLHNVAKNPQDMQAKLDLAEAQFASGAREDAVETLLAAIAQDREWNEQAARKALLKFFEALGHGDPLTVAARKKLSTLLFS
jgi:putative thioredoxin